MPAMKATILVLAAWLILVNDCRAQHPDGSPKPRIELYPFIPKTPEFPDSLKIEGWPDFREWDKVYWRPDSTHIMADAFGPPSGPADVDPEIWIRPDDSVDAKIQWYKPPKGLDSRMIIPRHQSLHGIPGK